MWTQVSWAPPQLAQLRELEEIVARLDQEGVEQLPEYRQWLRMLILPGTSLGGARPKASFTDEDGSMWIAKFPASDDRRDAGLLEFLVGELARRAGVDVPPMRRYRFSTRGHTFAVQRFDRINATRRVYASAMTLVQRRDGEVRTHGFLRAPDGWRLSPAFDSNPNPDKDIHALAIDADDPRPVSAHLRGTSDCYRLKPAQVDVIEEEVRGAARAWRRLADEIGASVVDTALLGAAMDPAR